MLKNRCLEALVETKMLLFCFAPTLVKRSFQISVSQISTNPSKMLYTFGQILCKFNPKNFVWVLVVVFIVNQVCSMILFLRQQHGLLRDFAILIYFKRLCNNHLDNKILFPVFGIYLAQNILLFDDLFKEHFGLAS